MPRSHRPATPAFRELAGGLAALVLVVVLVAGLPVLLWRMVGWPLPHAVPSLAELREAVLHGRISDQVVVNGLAVLTWLAWAQFTACLLVEATAALQGHLARHVPLAAWGTQALAARLVGAVLLLAPLTTPARPAAAAPVVVEATAARLFEPNIPAHPDAGRPAASEVRHVVQPKETLWGIAERHFGDGRRWPTIFERNKDQPQPDGRRLTNPNRIHPGWILALPRDVAPPAAGNGDRQQAPAAAPQPPTPRQPAPPAPAAPSTTEPEPGAQPGRPSHAHHRQSVRLPSGALVGIALATALGAALTLAWLHRRRAYRPSPPAPGMRETDPLLTPAMRRIYHAARQPDDEAAEDHDSPGAPIPITRSRNRTQPARPAPPSHLRTVVVGIRDGQQVPLDLAATSPLGITGPGAHAAVRALVAATVATEHGDAAQVLLAGQDLAAELLPEVPSLPGLTLLPDLPTALARLEVELVHRTRLLDSDDTPDVATFAAAHPAEPLPLLLLVTPPAPPPLQQRLAAVTTLGRRLGIGVVTLGAAPDGPTVEVAADGHVDATDPPAALPELDGAWLFTLPADEVRQVLAVVATASGTTPPPEPTDSVQPAGEPSAQVTTMLELAGREPEQRPVRVRLLGPLRLDALGVEVKSGLRTKARELLAFLVLHPAGATTDQIVDALWPDVDPQRGVQRFRTTLGNLRSTLKLVIAQPDATAVEWTGSHYRIQADLFDCDTWRLQAALDQAAHQPDPAAQIAALEQAVACYAGDLLEGDGALWAEPPRQDLRRRAIDALVRLAELHQHADSLEAALHALERAIALDPYAEDLYRRAMRLHARLHRPDGVRRTLRHLENRLEELDVDPAEATIQLADELLTQAKENSATKP